MSCPVCNLSPCVCGDSYYKLTDEAFLAHLSVIQRIAKDRGVDAKVTVNDVSIDDYINNLNIAVDTSVSLTAMLTNFVDVPEYFMARLNAHKGESVIKFVDDLKNDFDYIGFPLLVAIYSVLPNKVNIEQLRSKLILNFYNNIVEVDYNFAPPMVPCSIDDFFKAHRNADEFNKCVYQMHNAYANLVRTTTDKEPTKLNEVCWKYAIAMTAIENILSDGDSQMIIYHAMKLLCGSLPKYYSLFSSFEKDGKINNSMRDELQNANYAFCKVFENVVAGDLKV